MFGITSKHGTSHSYELCSGNTHIYSEGRALEFAHSLMSTVFLLLLLPYSAGNLPLLPPPFSFRFFCALPAASFTSVACH